MGRKIGYLTVIGLDESVKQRNSNRWVFKCDCGNVFSCVPSRVLSGHTRSCGCRKKVVAKTHGLSNNRFYHTWYAMMQRCYNPSNHNYVRYGARGIKVCKSWHNLVDFIFWAEQTYPSSSVGLTLDRINNDGEYSPQNCRWADVKTQSNNRRTNTIYTFNGVSKTFIQWCEFYGISAATVRERIHKLGWEPETAFSTPLEDANHDVHQIEIDGKINSLSGWCDELNAAHSTVYSKLAKGMSIKDALVSSARN